MEETGRDPMVAILENYVRTLEEEAEFQPTHVPMASEAGAAEAVAY